MNIAEDIQAVLDGTRRWVVIEGDCLAVMPTLGDKGVDHVITDPPYSEHVHSKNRRMLRGEGRGRRAIVKENGRVYRECGLVPLDFEALKPEVREATAMEFERVARRWLIAFTNAEAQHQWEADFIAAGARHIRVGAWVKIAAQPQLTGDRPGTGFEALEIAHASGQRCRWNAGGHHAVWTYQIATDRNGTGDRVHTTQKPVDLMMHLVSDFTDPDELILDPFCGSGTTGVACLRLGRRFIGIEKDAKYAAIARERLAAEDRGLSLRDARAGQTSIFDLVKP